MTFFPGQPCWIDLSVKDSAAREALMAFFGAVFDWTFDVGTAETGYYTMARRDGEVVCAIGEQTEGVGQWVIYLNAPDIDATTAAVASLGGQVFMGPMTVMTAGAMALAVDPTGAVFGLWQAGDFAGFTASGVPGTPGWFDQQSPAPKAARDFYTALFGFGFDEVHESGVGMLTSGGEMFASISNSPQEGMPPYWNPIFAVSSVDDVESRATAQGGTVLMSRMAVPGGLASAFTAPVTGTVVTVFQSGTD